MFVLYIAFLWFDCNFGWSDQPTFCGWSPDSIGQGNWLVQNHDMPSKPQLPNVDYSGKISLFSYLCISLATLARIINESANKKSFHI